MQDELHGMEGRPLQPTLSHQQPGQGAEACSLHDPDSPCHYGQQWAYLQFEQPVVAPQVGKWKKVVRGVRQGGAHVHGSQNESPACARTCMCGTHIVCAPQDALIIAAKFDGDVHGESCRLAFYGRVAALLDPTKPSSMLQLKVFKVRRGASWPPCKAHPCADPGWRGVQPCPACPCCSDR